MLQDQVQPRTREDQPTETVAEANKLTAAKIVRDVQFQLGQRRATMEAARDPRVVFTRAYETITGIVYDAIDEDIFQYPLTLAILDQRFANYYFRALDGYANREPIANAHVWYQVFDMIGAANGAAWTDNAASPNVSVLEMLVLPLIVHTVYDLPLAVAEVAVREGIWLQELARNESLETIITRADAIHGFDEGTITALLQTRPDVDLFQRYQEDFRAINDLLLDRKQGIDAIQKEIRKYNWFLRLLDLLAGKYDEVITWQALKYLREEAWYNAMQLLRAQSREESLTLLQEREDQTLAYIDRLYHSSLRLHLFIIVLRTVASLFANWPKPALIQYMKRIQSIFQQQKQRLQW